MATQVANTAAQLSGKVILTEDADVNPTGFWTFANGIYLRFKNLAGDASNVIGITPANVVNIDANGLGAMFGSTIREQSRTFAMGVAQTRTFSAANFAAISGGTWTVESGDVTTDSYRVVGNTLFWNVELVTTSLATTPSILRVTLPNSYQTQETAFIPAMYNDSGGAGISAIYLVATFGQTYVELRKFSGTFANSTNLAGFGFQVAIKVL